MKRILKLLFQILGSSLLLFIVVYGILRVYFFNIDGEFIYSLKKLTPENINNNIVVVEIDDLTYNKLGFPLNRDDYIPFIENIEEADPAVVGFDILFADKGKDSLTDLNLAQSFKDAGNIIIGFDANSQEAVLPYNLFSNSVSDIGYFTPIVNANNSKVYSINPIKELLLDGKKKLYESFSFSLLRKYFNYIYLKDEDTLSKNNISNDSYSFFDKLVPLISKELYILYSKDTSFQRESYYNVYTGNFDKTKFKDKIVLVGYTAQGVKDDFFVPGLKNGGILKGVYIHANTINNVLNDNYVIFFNKKIELFIGFIFIMLILYFNVVYNKNLGLRWVLFGSGCLFLIILTIYIVVFSVLYKNSGIFFVPNYPAEFASILFLSFFISSILKYVNEDKNKRMLSKALSEYVSSDITREILYSRGEVNLGGENKKISIFFSDIAGFTTISEKLTPEQLVSFLRVYLGDMSNIIMDNKGFINKYEGDAIMALWGVFGNIENYGIIDACESCLLQQEKLSLLNDEWRSEGKDELSVRMGLHTGNAIIGNIGAEGRKMEFTALGDSVNLASRLEGVNKAYNTYICCSEDVYTEAKEKFEFRYLDIIKVKGKNKGVKIYELVSRIGELSDLKSEIIAGFEEGIDKYNSRDFEEAIDIFEKLSHLGDGPSKVYFDRCKDFIQNPPDADWDGIYVMKTK